MKTTKKTYIPSKKHEQHLFHGKNLWARHSQAHGLGIYYDEERITYAGANSSYDGDLTGENQKKTMVNFNPKILPTKIWWFNWHDFSIRRELSSSKQTYKLWFVGLFSGMTYPYPKWSFT